MFEDRDKFNSSLDSKVPLKKTPLFIVIRGAMLIGSLLFSRYPGDLIVWLKAYRSRSVPLNYAIPWLTFDAIRIIKQKLPSNSAIFEYGSGHSTLYWAENGHQVVAVESDQSWHRMLADKIKKEKRLLDKVTVLYKSLQQEYINSIDQQQQDYDLILIDGAHRRECIEKAIPRLKQGGLLVVDNTDWHWLIARPLQGIPIQWQQYVCKGYAPMIGHISETTIWIKSS